MSIYDHDLPFSRPAKNQWIFFASWTTIKKSKRKLACYRQRRRHCHYLRNISGLQLKKVAEDLLWIHNFPAKKF